MSGPITGDRLKAQSRQNTYVTTLPTLNRASRFRPKDRQSELSQTRNLKIARSAHAYVRGSTVKFYEWLEDSAGKVPTGPPI
jgi:uncharacterized protein (DUF2252 family)